MKEAITEYIRRTDRPNFQDIWCHFKLCADIIAYALEELMGDKIVKRVDHFAAGWNGNHHYEIN